jgi:hypothetical protein
LFLLSATSTFTRHRVASSKRESTLDTRAPIPSLSLSYLQHPVYMYLYTCKPSRPWCLYTSLLFAAVGEAELFPAFLLSHLDIYAFLADCIHFLDTAAHHLDRDPPQKSSPKLASVRPQH